MRKALFWFIFLWSLFINAQDQDRYYYENLISTFNEGMAYWGQSPTEYKKAIDRLLIYEKEMSNLYRMDPRVDTEYFKWLDSNFATSNRLFIRFMFNITRNRPKLAKQYKTLNYAWDMVQRQKSFFSRFFAIKGIYDNLPEEKRKKVDSLLYRKAQIVNDNRISNHEIDKYIDGYSTYSQNVATLQDLQNGLNGKDTYLSFIYSNNGRAVYVWKVEKNYDKVFKLRINSSDLFIRAEMIKALIEKDITFFNYLKKALEYEKKGYSKYRRTMPFLEDGYSLNELLKTMSNKLIAPLNISNGRNIIIEIDQNLASLPFEVLTNKGNKLLTTNTISYTHSASAFLSKGTIENSNDLKYLGFGYDNNGELLVANDEVRNSSALFEVSEAVINSSETELYKIVNANECDILHFSTHSSLNVLETKIEYQAQNGETYKGISQEREIALLYGADEDNNGLITPSDVFENFNYDRKNTMLILSSCEVAPSLNIKKFLGLQVKVRTKENEDESKKSELIPVIGGCICTFSEPISALMSSFSAKGYRNIIATKWKVNAYFANSFVHTFLSYYKREKNFEKALQLAQLHYLEDEPMENWSAFSYIRL